MSAGPLVTRNGGMRVDTGRALPLAETQPYRACHLCTHGLTVNEQRYCQCRPAVAPKSAVPVHLVRAPNGPCGPEAHLMAYPGF
jgi:hypothetical protein